MKTPFKVALVMLSLNACTHSIHQVYSSGFDPYEEMSAGEIVKAKSEQFTVMGFASDTNYVDAAYAQLQAECPNDPITAITTQFSTSHGFFSWTNKILIQGLCLREAKTSQE